MDVADTYTLLLLLSRPLNICEGKEKYYLFGTGGITQEVPPMDRTKVCGYVNIVQDGSEPIVFFGGVNGFRAEL